MIPTSSLCKNGPAGRERAVWLIALGLAFGPAVSNGLARFAYALILPAMRADLHWTYATAGWINTANTLGYLIGSYLTFRVVNRYGAVKLFNAGMWVTAGGLILSGLTSSFPILLGTRLLVGISGAPVFVCGGVLAAGVFPDNPKRSAATIAAYFAGGGIGIFLSGVSLPWMFSVWGDAAWRAAWIGLGVLSLAACPLSVWAARSVAVQPRETHGAQWDWRPLFEILAAYFLFALGYIAYMTFIVAWMREHGASAARIGLVWGVLGLATIFSPRLWNRALATWSAGRPMAATLLMVAIGAALPLVTTALPILLLSALLFGGAFFITPAAITTFVKGQLPQHAWGQAIAAVTLVFAAGQTLGPVMTGVLSDAFGSSLFAGLAVSVAVLLGGAIMALCQKSTRS